MLDFTTRRDNSPGCDGLSFAACRKLCSLIILLVAAFLSLLALSGPAGAVDNPDYASTPPPGPTQHSVPPIGTPPADTPPSGTGRPPFTRPRRHRARRARRPSTPSIAHRSPPSSTARSRGRRAPQRSPTRRRRSAFGTTAGASSSEPLAYTGTDTLACCSPLAQASWSSAAWSSWSVAGPSPDLIDPRRSAPGPHGSTVDRYARAFGSSRTRPVAWLRHDPPRRRHGAAAVGGRRAGVPAGSRPAAARSASATAGCCAASTRSWPPASIVVRRARSAPCRCARPPRSASACAAGWRSLVSIVRRRPGVSGQPAEHDRRTARVAAMTGIDRQAKAGEHLGAREFPPCSTSCAGRSASIGLVGRRLDAGRRHGCRVAARSLAGAAFLGAVTDAMLLGHWYLVQPGLPRRLLNELVGAIGWIWPVEVARAAAPDRGWSQRAERRRRRRLERHARAGSGWPARSRRSCS